MDKIEATLDRMGGHLADLHSSTKMTAVLLTQLTAKVQSQEETVQALRGDFEGLKSAVMDVYDKYRENSAEIAALKTRMDAIERRAS